MRKGCNSVLNFWCFCNFIPDDNFWNGHQSISHQLRRLHVCGRPFIVLCLRRGEKKQQVGCPRKEDLRERLSLDKEEGRQNRCRCKNVCRKRRERLVGGLGDPTLSVSSGTGRQETPPSMRTEIVIFVKTPFLPHFTRDINLNIVYDYDD